MLKTSLILIALLLAGCTDFQTGGVTEVKGDCQNNVEGDLEFSYCEFCPIYINGAAIDYSSCGWRQVPYNPNYRQDADHKHWHKHRGGREHSHYHERGHHRKKWDKRRH